MSETLARYNVILDLQAQASGLVEATGEVKGMQKEFVTAKQGFEKIFQKQMVNDVVAGLGRMRKELGDIGKNPGIDSLITEIEKLAEKADLTEIEFERLQVASNKLGQELGKAFNGMPEQLAAFASKLNDISGTDVEGLENKIKQLALAGDTSSEEFKQAAKELGLYKARLLEADRAVEIYAKSTDALTGALGEYEDRLYDLRLAGKQNTDEYKELIAKVIQMKEAIRDVDAQVDKFVEKRNGFASVLKNVELLGAGFQLTEGITAAFGESSEELQATLVRLNAVMAITSALEQARVILVEQSIEKTGIATAVQKGYALVIGNSTGALRAFRVALAGLGIGAVIGAVILLVQNWDKVKESLFGVNKAQEAYKKTLEDYRSAANDAALEVQKVDTAFRQAKEGLISKDEALRIYNETLGDSFGKTKSLEEAEKSLTDKADAYIKVTALKAQANALLALSTEKSVKASTASLEDQRTFVDKILASIVGGVVGVGSAATLAAEQQGKNVANIIKTNTKEADDLLKLYQKLTDQAQVLANDKGIIDPDAAAAAEKAAADAAKAAEEARKRQQALEIEAAEQRAVNRRNEARKTIEDEQELAKAVQLIYLQKELEILKINQKYAERNSVEFKALGRQIEEKNEQIQALGRTLSDVAKLGVVEAEANRQLNDTVTLLKSLEDFGKSGKLSKAFGEDVGKMVKFFSDIPAALAENREKIRNEVITSMGKTFDATMADFEKRAERQKQVGLASPMAKALGMTEDEFQKFVAEPINQTIDAINQVLEQETQVAQKRVELQQRRVDKALALAEKGNVKQLEIEEDRLAKLQEQQEAAAKRQQQIQQIQLLASQGLAAAKSIEAITQAAALPFPANIPAITATSLALLGTIGSVVASVRGSFNDIPGFWDGSELIGADPRYRKYKVTNGRDGYLFRGDGSERMVDGETNAKLNGFPNYLLPEAVKAYYMMPNVNTTAVSNNYVSNESLVYEVKAMREALEAMYVNVTLDKDGFAVHQQRMQQKAITRKKLMA